MASGSLTVDGQAIDVSDIFEEANARPSPVSVETQEAEDTDVRAADPVTSWFRTPPMGQESMQFYKQNGQLDQFEEAFAHRFSQDRPQTVEDYIALGDNMIQVDPGMSPHIKRRMLEAMPNNLRTQYEQRTRKAEALRLDEEAYERQEAKRERTSASLPEGWTLGPDGKIVETAKTERENAKAIADITVQRAELLDMIDNEKDREGANPRVIKGLERKLAELDAYLTIGIPEEAPFDASQFLTESPEFGTGVGLVPESAAPAGPPVGTVSGGFTFKGGDPNDQKNWSK